VKEIIYAAGAFALTCFLAGSLGMIDCHLCAKAAGQCKVLKDTP
jgi:hypothetical protein